MGRNLNSSAFVRLAFFAVAAATTLLIVGALPAWAANASDLNVEMTATPNDTVSVSRQNLTAYIAYRVTLQNTGGNTINQVRLKGSTTTSDGSVASFSSVVVNAGIAPTCGPTGTQATSCSVGQMKAGTSSDFFLLFQTPTTTTNPATLTFTLDTTFSEGNSPNSPPANITEPTITAVVALITTDDPGINSHVKTVLPPAGGTFFTGPNGVVSSTNPFATLMTLPGVTSLVTSNRIDLSSVPSFACNGTYFCFGLMSEMNVDKALDGSKVFYDVVAPGQFITIVLRQDISSLSTKKPVPKVGDVRIFYNPSPLLPGDVGNLVPACSSDTTLPKENAPCVANRINNVKGNKGYYEYWIQAVDNGRLSW